MTLASILADASLGFALFAGASAPFIVSQGPPTDFSFMRDLAGAGGVGAVLVVLYLTQKDRKEEREKQAEERQKHAELIAKERELATAERQHGFDRVTEITGTFAKTVLDLATKK